MENVKNMIFVNFDDAPRWDDFLDPVCFLLLRVCKKKQVPKMVRTDEDVSSRD